MTIEEFQNHAWGAGDRVRYRHNISPMVVCSVDFNENLICICSKEFIDDEDEWLWVRCENCELIKEE